MVEELRAAVRHRRGLVADGKKAQQRLHTSSTWSGQVRQHGPVTVVGLEPPRPQLNAGGLLLRLRKHP